MTPFARFLAAILVFVTTVITAAPQAEAQQCVDIFTLADLKPFTQMHTKLEPWELPEAGLFLKPRDAIFATALYSMIAHRDGTYAVLFDSSGSFAITHRLPNNRPAPGHPYLATHRGLYSKLQINLDRQPKVVFAGELLIIGGKAVHLIDQSGTFHSLISEFSNYGDKARQQMINENQQRLDFASTVLRDLRVIDANTEVINFAKWLGMKNPTSYSHITTKMAADFEISCRANPACWNKAQRIDIYLRDIMAKGGAKYLLKLNFAKMPFDYDQALAFVSMLNIFITDGVFETLAGRDRMDPQTENGALVETFYQSLESPLGNSLRFP